LEKIEIKGDNLIQKGMVIGILLLFLLATLLPAGLYEKTEPSLINQITASVKADELMPLAEMVFKADAGGPYVGIIEEPVIFNGSAWGGEPPYSWYWDFGDGFRSYQQNPQHIYTTPGNYTIFFRVTDSSQGQNKNATDTTWANIREINYPPTAPLVLGATRGVAGVVYNYTFTSTDPEGDMVTYIIDWGDGGESGIGPLPEGITGYINYSWAKEGVYLIRAKTIDQFGGLSPWTTIEIYMPRNKNSLDGSEVTNSELYLEELPTV